MTARHWGVGLLAAAALAALTLAAFWEVRRLDFVNYDDPGYVTGNSHVRAGVTPVTIAWALTTDTMANWHPLTWWSHLLDVELFGLDPAGHHLTSLLLHVLNALLLFAVLTAMTGAPWRSLTVAGLFALHPLHVESVAWVAERKDVLSGTFALLTIGAYLRWVRRPSAARYVLVMLALTLGLMAKPMLVTLPIMLLLLDVWPLRRWSPASSQPTSSLPRAGQLVLEKLPLFLVVALSGVVTIIVQHRAGAVRSTAEVPLAARVGNAVLAYGRYLEKTVWPFDLACFYPIVLPLPRAQLLAAVVGIAVATGAALVARRRRPYVTVGWLWFVVMLLPVIGIVQAGPQAMADRYTYLPLIGIFVLVVWGVADLVPPMRARLLVLTAMAGTVLAVCFVLTRTQVTYWRNSHTLFEHALAVTRPNSISHLNLGIALAAEGRPTDAIAHYREAVRITPSYADAHALLGAALQADAEEGALEEAVAQFDEVLRLDPARVDIELRRNEALIALGRIDEAIVRLSESLLRNADRPEVHNALGVALAGAGRDEQAIAQYRMAIGLAPDYVDPRVNLAGALRRADRLDEAASELETALAADPHHPEAHYMLGNVLAQRGALDDAAAHYTAALAARPRYAEAANNLGLVRAAQGDLDEAIARYSESVRSDAGFAPAYYNRGVAYRRKGDLVRADADFSRARALDPRTPQ